MLIIIVDNITQTQQYPRLIILFLSVINNNVSNVHILNFIRQ